MLAPDTWPCDPKADYWGVPVTEEVPEFYRCDSYEPRIPGTGYRG